MLSGIQLVSNNAAIHDAQQCMEYVLINHSLKENTSEKKISLDQQVIFAGSEGQFPNWHSIKQKSEAFGQSWNFFARFPCVVIPVRDLIPKKQKTKNKKVNKYMINLEV